MDTLDRAVNTITREAQKNPAAFTQVDTSSMSTLLQSLRCSFVFLSANDRDRGSPPPIDCGRLLAQLTLRCDYQYFQVF